MKKEAPLYRRFSDLKRRAEKNGWNVFLSARIDYDQPIASTNGNSQPRRRRRDFTNDLAEFQNLAKLGKLFNTQVILEKPISNGGGVFQLLGFLENEDDFSKMWRMSAQKHLTNANLPS